MPFIRKRAQEEPEPITENKRARSAAAEQFRSFATIHDAAQAQLNGLEPIEQAVPTDTEVSSIETLRESAESGGNLETQVTSASAEASDAQADSQSSRQARQRNPTVKSQAGQTQRNKKNPRSSELPAASAARRDIPLSPQGERPLNYDPDYNPLNLHDAGLELWKRSMARLCSTRDHRRICLHHQQNNRSQNKSKTSSDDLHSMDCFYRDGPCSFIKSVTEHMLVLKGIMYERRKNAPIKGLHEGFAEAAWETFLMGLTLQYGIRADAEKKKALQENPLLGLTAFWTDMAECQHMDDMVPIVQAL